VKLLLCWDKPLIYLGEEFRLANGATFVYNGDIESAGITAYRSNKER